MASGLNFDLIHETPHPILAWLDGLHDRMLRRVKVLRCMFVLRRIAASNVATLVAKTQVHPGVAHFEALFAAVGVGANVFDMTLVRTAFAHDAASCSCLGWLLLWNLGCCKGMRTMKRVSPGL